MKNQKRPCGHSELKLGSCEICQDRVLEAMRWGLSYPSLGTGGLRSMKELMQAAVDRYEDQLQ